MNFCILGAGAWGTAMAVHLNRAGHAVTLVPRRLEHAAALATTRENTEYLPGFRLSPDIQIASEIAPAIMEADAVFLACPSKGLRALAERLKPALAGARRAKIFISLCKGLEQQTLLRPAEVLAEVLPDVAHGVLSGPTNAAEVARGLPAAVVFAADVENETVLEVQHALSDKTFRVYRSQDVAGVELGGILKNIYAIGAGICDGLELGSNAKASYLTRALHETVLVGTAAGGQRETFYGLSGVGDLIATANGSWSRNRTLGETLVRTRESAKNFLESRRTVAEGYFSVESFHRFSEKNNVPAPILETLYHFMFSGKDIRELMEMLMQRMLRAEQ